MSTIVVPPTDAADLTDAAGRAGPTGPTDSVGPTDTVGLSQGTEGARGATVLQRIVVDRPPAVRDLYWRNVGNEAEPAWQSGADLLVPRRGAIRFDTYFNAFFEHHWRRYTRVRAVELRIRAHGDFDLRVYRRTREAGDVLLSEERVQSIGDTPIRVGIPADAGNFRSAGYLFFEIAARSETVRVCGGAWMAPDAVPDPVRLAPVFCTFNREPELTRILARLGDDAAALAGIERVIVVNQGRPGLAEHPAVKGLPQPMRQRLTIIEQGNFGGAGGFTRGILAALDMPEITHVIIMDDDVEIEPESLLRTAALFSLKAGDMALGGHMLDGLRPTRLYESGAYIHPTKWWLEPNNFDLDVRNQNGLDRLLDTPAMHYNGWWFFAFPLSFVQRVGLPMPCFIRGDDVEFGRRLHDQGLHTVAVPGVAIWHEPFYVKLGGWQLYYETRNILIAAARHFPAPPRALVMLLLRRLLIHLLTFRYYNAALVLRAVEDYMAGPQLFETSPQSIHASLEDCRRAYPQATIERERVIGNLPVRGEPRLGRIGFVLAMLGAVWSNAVRPTRPGAPPLRVQARDLVWFRVAHADHLAVETYWDERLPAQQRSREAFRTLLGSGLRLLARLYVRAEPVAAAWREAHPHFTTRAFWQRYLKLEPQETHASILRETAAGKNPAPSAAPARG